MEVACKTLPHVWRLFQVHCATRDIHMYLTFLRYDVRQTCPTCVRVTSYKTSMILGRKLGFVLGWSSLTLCFLSIFTNTLALWFYNAVSQNVHTSCSSLDGCAAPYQLPMIQPLSHLSVADEPETKCLSNCQRWEVNPPLLKHIACSVGGDNLQSFHICSSLSNIGLCTCTHCQIFICASCSPQLGSGPDCMLCQSDNSLQGLYTSQILCILLMISWQLRWNRFLLLLLLLITLLLLCMQHHNTCTHAPHARRNWKSFFRKIFLSKLGGGR